MRTSRKILETTSLILWSFILTFAVFGLKEYSESKKQEGTICICDD